MRVIGVASRKGGSGKTTLSAHLAVAAEAAGAGPVAIMDADPQGGLAGWWNARQAEAPHWIDLAHGLPTAVKAARAAGYSVLLIDTPPSLSETITEVMALADLVVVMSPGPGRIDNEYVIDLPRPRDIASAEFNKWRRLLSSQLHSHHARKVG